MPYRAVTKVYKPKAKTIRNVCRRIRERGGWKDDLGREHGPWPAYRFERAEAPEETVEAPVINARDLVGDYAGEIDTSW
jgi:hypothetical protein